MYEEKLLEKEDIEEISNQIDKIALSQKIEKQFKVVNRIILIGTGKDITRNIGNHLDKKYEYEIIIKQIQP